MSFTANYPDIHVASQLLTEAKLLNPGPWVQHSRLVAQAERIAREQGFERMAVIAGIGTRRYYQVRGFEPGELYLVKTTP